jgi:DNA-directed RNA polymerase subunit RPC12/RpoP
MSEFSRKVFKLAAEEQTKQQSSLCERLGHPVYPAGNEEITCPRCGMKVVSYENRMNPRSVPLEEFNKVSKVKILGAENKPTFSNTLMTEEII